MAADLATLLEAEAKGEIDTVLAAAREKAATIVARASAEAQSLLAGRKAALASEAASGRIRAQSAADLEAAALRLGAGHQANQAAFDHAEAELRGLTKTSEYPNVLAKLVSEVQAALGEVTKLQVHPSELAAAQAAVQSLGLTGVQLETSPEIETGVRGFAQGGQSAITNTLVGRLARARDGLLADVSRLLK
jgi:V/A-type H+/Na+-transporting ATPase subunit E